MLLLLVVIVFKSNGKITRLIVCGNGDRFSVLTGLPCDSKIYEIQKPSVIGGAKNTPSMGVYSPSVNPHSVIFATP